MLAAASLSRGDRGGMRVRMETAERPPTNARAASLYTEYVTAGQVASTREFPCEWRTKPESASGPTQSSGSSVAPRPRVNYEPNQ